MSGFGLRRRVFAQEVVQTSAMDCGPASLKCLLEGFGIPVSYGRLREACQTDVDGTSIDDLEEVAKQLGLDAEQVMLPLDHLLLAEAEALPALLVVRLPNGFTHFVVVWRRHGPLVQIMDPGSGRRWLTSARLLRDVYVHELRLPAADWQEWASSEEFLSPLVRRLSDLGLQRASKAMLKDATECAHWRGLATLDAATRLVASLVRAKAVRCGQEAERVIHGLLERAGNAPPGDTNIIPHSYWSVRCAPAAASGEPSSESEEIILRGAVLVLVRGPLPCDHRAQGQRAEVGVTTSPDSTSTQSPATDQPTPLSPELAAALAESPSRPVRELFRLLRGDGVFSFLVLGGGLALAAGSVFLEALVLRGVIDIGQDLGLVTQRLQAASYFLLFALALLLIELRVAHALLRLGRRLDTRLRVALFGKIPRMPDRYFQSRPISDMAERGHSIHQLRLLPRLGGQLVRAVLSVVVTGAALVWLYPAGAPVAVLAAILAVGLPLAFKPHLEEMDLRVRTHTGALSRFYLDALLGLTTVRAHSAECAVRREHEGLLVEWAQASLRLVRATVALDGLQFFTGFGLAALLLLLYSNRAGEPAGALLLAYWALYLPILGEEVALLVRQYPIHRNLALRLFEPLGAPEESSSESVDSAPTRLSRDAYAQGSISGGSEQSLAVGPDGVAVVFESIAVRAAGHEILREVDLSIRSGTHVAIVGGSGAGKSSLVGLLLGWHRPATGRVLVDGYPLDTSRLNALRRDTVWVDPAIQVWNRPLLANITYGTANADRLPLAEVLEQADLYDLLERLPDGLQTYLGEGGGLVSGGEGQRVRLARGLLRSSARLVILDEPFRGLERAKRRDLLELVRQRWRCATLLCITHDVSDTRDFERVLVVDDGRVVEDGSPADLGRSGSHYQALLDVESAVAKDLWASAAWTRMRLESGRLQEDPSASGA